jgi:hypothetical protein
MDTPDKMLKLGAETAVSPNTRTINTREDGKGMWQAWKRNRNADGVLEENTGRQTAWKT